MKNANESRLSVWEWALGSGLAAGVRDLIGFEGNELYRVSEFLFVV